MNLPATVLMMLTHCAPAAASDRASHPAAAAHPGHAELERMRAALSRRRVRARTAATIEAELRALALSQHKAARATRRGPIARSHYTVAGAAYALYMEHFPSGIHSHAMHYAYGELHYQTKDYSAAYAEYMRAVQVDPSGPHAQFCAESAVYAAEAMLEAERAAGRAEVAPRGSTVALPPSPWDTHLQAALTQYIDLWPDGKRALQLRYRSAWNHLQLRQTVAAHARFREVIARAPSSREAAQAAHLMIDTYAAQEDYAALVALVDHVLADPRFGSPQVRAELTTVRTRALERMNAPP